MRGKKKKNMMIMMMMAAFELLLLFFEAQTNGKTREIEAPPATNYH